MHTTARLYGAALLLLLAACGAQPERDPAEERKYELSGLPEVDRIQNYRLHGWQSIDGRSLIVDTGPSTFYLVILNRNLTHLRNAEAIAISPTAGTGQARFDTVPTLREPMDKATIQRIYRLNGRDEAQLAKKAILAY